MKTKIISFFAGMLFMMVFGIIDNAFLFVGMDWMSPLVNMFKDPQLSAMWGNTFSDGIGAIAGIVVSYVFLKVFKVKPSDHITVEVIGVLIGCLIPILVYIVSQ